MSKLRIISSLGDKMVIWDGEKAEQGDPDAIAAVKEAERIFSEARAKGAVAFKIEGSKPGERVDAFDSKAEQIVVVPRMVGG